jgi:hypothetical protein
VAGAGDGQGEEDRGQHEDLHGGHRLRPARDKPEEDSDPDHREAQQDQQADGGQRVAHARVDAPADRPPAPHQRHEPHQRVQQVRQRAPADDGGPGHRERPQAGGDPALSVGHDRGHRRLQPDHRRQRGQAGREPLG